MSRLKRFGHSLASGYVLLCVNALYTFASVPLVLHYLVEKEFGLWALVTQISSSLSLLDLGMAGSVARILIDHKDRPGDGRYGAVIKTGALVMVVQGAVVAAAGLILSFWLPALFKISAVYQHDFQVLVAAQCGILGGLFAGRICSHVLQAHQRYDVTNHAQSGALVVSLGVLWLGFAAGWGLYSLLAASTVTAIVSNLYPLVAVLRLKLFPAAGAWGKVSWSLFKELFKFGTDLFLMSVGYQLTSASQVMMISRTLGLKEAAVWAIATKVFVVMQQAVFQLWTFSANTISEMIVRKEWERVRRRFRDLVVLSGVSSILAAGVLGACNGSFLEVWTKGRINWSVSNDWLLSLLLVVSCVARCHVGLAGQTKKILAMRYIYFIEGLCFVIGGVLVAPFWGITGILFVGITMNIVWSGVYAVYRTARELNESIWHVAFGWMKSPLRFLLLFLPLGAACEWVLRPLSGLLRLSLSAALVGATGLALGWFVGLTPELRAELTGVTVKLRKRIWPK